MTSLANRIGRPRRMPVRRDRATSFWPGLEDLEARVVLNGGHAAVGAAPAHTAARAADVAAQVTSADTQVLNLMEASLSKYANLQIQLDGLATKLQKQSRSARTATANHAQTLVKKFVKLENKNYKPIVALARTVTGDPVFSALFQLEASTHQDLLTVKTQVLPQFRLLIGATFSANATQSRLNVSAAATDFHAGGQANALDAGGPERDIDSGEADSVMENLVILMDALSSPLQALSNAPNTSCAFVASHSLRPYSTLLDVMLVFYDALQPLLSSDEQEEFVAVYNQVVTVFNAAVTRTNQILASSSIHTHP